MEKVTQKFVMGTPLFNACVLRAKPGALDTRAKRREFANALKEVANSGIHVRFGSIFVDAAFIWSDSPQGWDFWYKWALNTI